MTTPLPIDAGAPHLHPLTRKLLDLPDAARRQAVLSDKWAPYTRAQEVLAKMENLLLHPPSHRMPNMLLVGDTNNGKTAILQHFLKAHPQSTAVENGQLHWPVLYIQAPAEPDERRLYNAILEQVGVPHHVREHIDKKHTQAVHVLQRLQVRVLIIDEIHHVLAGSLKKQHLFLNVLKHLSNELMIPLVCAGIRTAFNAVQSDAQLANRFDPVALPLWTVGDEYSRLLLSFERLLPLRKPSGLDEDPIALKLLSMSEGTIGEISKILKQAAVEAIGTKQECVTLGLLNRLDYTVPSNRMKFHQLP